MFTVAAITSLLSLFPLAGPAPIAATDITARGSDSTIVLVKALAEAYTKSTGQAIKVEGGGSSRGAEACAKGDVNFCFLSRDLKDSEKSQELKSKPYALDGVAVIVNKANPIDDTTIEQLKGWFSGTVINWPDNKPVVAFNRNADSGTREVFQDKVLKDAKFGDKAAVKHDGVLVSSVAKIATAVAYTSVGEVTAEVKAIKVNGVAPTHETLRDKSYALSRTLYFATKGEPTPEVKAFIDWTLGKEGQAIVDKSGYTSLGSAPATAGVTTDK